MSAQAGSCTLEIENSIHQLQELDLKPGLVLEHMSLKTMLSFG